MTLATTVGVVLLPFGERPQYGQPYPEGFAVAYSEAADDNSGGDHTFTVVADGGFIFRLEAFNFFRGSTTAEICTMLTSHSWATARSGFPSGAFDMFWPCPGTSTGDGSSTYKIADVAATTSGDSAMQMLKRFPWGRTDNVSLQQLAFLKVDTQVNTVTNAVGWVWSYWRKSALYQPGFLSAFWEAPAVPPLIKLPTG